MSDEFIAWFNWIVVNLILIIVLPYIIYVKTNNILLILVYFVVIYFSSKYAVKKLKQRGEFP